MRKLAAVIALLALLLAGCVSREENSGAKQAPDSVPLSELSDLTLQVGDQKGNTETLLRAAGVLQNLPYKIAFSTFTSGPPQVEGATAGKIDFAITGNSPPIFGAASNAKVKVVSAYDGGGNGDQIVVHADSQIQSIAELRGKKIAVGKGSSAHGHVLGQLDKAGLATSDVTLVFLQPAACAVCVHPAAGRRVGHLGPLHRADRRAGAGSRYRTGQGRRQRLLVRHRVGSNRFSCTEFRGLGGPPLQRHAATGLHQSIST
jgi:ABC-type nitrate/sulfonate/bicarbonate transport system substrate-binding protein